MTERTITTVAELAAVYGGGVITNDRGNGAGGPSYLHEDDAKAYGDTLGQVRIEEISETEDPEAWQLAREAAIALGLDTPKIVCVGERHGDPNQNPHQWIYAV